jgi:hypothetical protein
MTLSHLQGGRTRAKSLYGQTSARLGEEGAQAESQEVSSRGECGIPHLRRRRIETAQVGDPQAEVF